MFTRIRIASVALLVALQASVTLAATPDFTGSWTNEKVQLMLAGNGTDYEGTLTVSGQVYPCVARFDDIKGFNGVFNTPQQQFPISMTLNADGTATLTSGNSRHVLKRVANDVPGGQPVRAALPELLKPGTRLTWKGGASTRAGSHLVPDPEGLIMVKGVRHSFRDSRGGGGMGFCQLTIQQAEPELVACEVRNFTLTGVKLDTLYTGLHTGITGNANAIGDFWMNPAQLAAMEEGRDIDGTTTYRRDYKIDQQTFKAITIYTYGGSTYSSLTYDLATGCLLFKAAATVDPSTIVEAGNNTYTVRGNVNSEHLLFVGTRQVNFAFANEVMPDWAAKGRRLEYRGGAAIAGALMAPDGVSLSYTVTGGTKHFFTAHQLAADQNTAQFGLPAGEADRLFGAHMYRGLWASPRAMQQMRPQQVLDQDPITGMRTIFVGVQNGVALIVEQGGSEMTECFYDMQTGMLVSFNYTKSSQIGKTIESFRLVGQR